MSQVQVPTAPWARTPDLSNESRWLTTTHLTSPSQLPEVCYTLIIAETPRATDEQHLLLWRAPQQKPLRVPSRAPVHVLEHHVLCEEPGRKGWHNLHGSQ